jgi:hypothetical protein
MDEMTADEESDIIKSSFYEYSKQAGIRCYVHKEVKDLLVYICNKFDELGFAFISLYAHPNAKASLAMDVNRRYSRLYEESCWRATSGCACRRRVSTETRSRMPIS